MSYAFERDEPASAALRRIASEQVDSAIATLRDDGIGLEERVHEARKRFKETRALIRLYRGVLTGGFAVENRWYRDAGRELAAYRDATAAVEAVDGLDRKTRGEIGRTGMRRLRRAVKHRRDAQFAAPDDLCRRIDNIVAQLPIGAARIHDEPLSLDDDFACIAAGLRRTFRDGRRAMRIAYESGNDAAFHEWRKRVKDHWYHVLLLQPMWPEVMLARAKVLRDLSQALGRHHDLTVVRTILASEPDSFGGEMEAMRIADLLIRRQKELAEKASGLGMRLYAERPQLWVQQIEALWGAWRVSTTV